MQISRYIKPNLIKLEMETVIEQPDTDEQQVLTLKRVQARKELILTECVDVLNLSGKVGNRNKLLKDLFDREKKATTALGKGIAIPHVRTMQAKELIIAILRSTDGYDFEAPDNLPVQLFVAMAAPPYDDSLYLRVFRAIAQIFSVPGSFDRIMGASEPYDVIRAIKDLE